MSDNEHNGGSPIDRSKRPRFEEEEWDSEYERDGQDDRHPKRLAVPDPETKAPHFVPSEEQHNEKSRQIKRKKWEEGSEDDEVKSQSTNKDKDQTEEETIYIRALVSTKDAGIIIGRGGKNVSDIREISSARVTISEIVPGAYERILTVSGPVHAVAKAYSLVGEKILLENSQQEEGSRGDNTVHIKLLVPDSKMGVLIGKGGCIIKSIQEASGARVNASEESLPMSTERTVSIQGAPDAIKEAVYRVATTLSEHTDRMNANLVQYRPIPMHNNPRTGTSNNSNMPYMNMRSNNNAAAAAVAAATAAAMGYGGMMPMSGMPMNNANQFYYGGNPSNGYGNMSSSRQSDYNMNAMNMMGGMGNMTNLGGMAGMGMSGMTGSSHAQQIFIPNEMVGCIIGKGGSKINEIRQLSGSHIKIADPHGETNERLVTITGSPESNQMALYLLYSRLESEKSRLGLLQ